MSFTPKPFPPGPWRIQADMEATDHQRSQWAPHRYRYITTDHEFTERGIDGDGEIICATRDSESQVSIAHLLSAAPDLLEACEAMVAAHRNGNCVDVAAVHHCADQAIKKARGL